MNKRMFGGLAAFALLALPGSSGPAFCAEAEPVRYMLELPDDPPGTPTRQDPLVRSAATVVSVGPYVSRQVNVDGLGQNIVGDAANEPSLSINPLDPDNIVIAWRQFDTIASNFRQAGWAYSFDGGLGWTFPGVLQPGQFRSDPVLDFDAQGNVYYQSLTNSLELDVFKSTDGSISWSSPVDAFGGDKNWIAIDRTAGPGAGNVYEIWQRFAACCGVNSFSRSVNAAASFEPPVPVSRSPTFGTLAVGPDGDVYAAGIDGSVTQNLERFVVARSTDAENPFGTPTFTSVTVPLNGRMVLGAGPNPGGLLGQANVAVDHSNGPTRGNVYLMASVAPALGIDPLDVYIARSVDGGSSWSSPVRVNDDAPAGDAWQWFAALSVSPEGRLDVVWNDTRHGATPNFSELFYAYSWDAGTTWHGNIPVSPMFNSFLGFPNQNKIGDYITIVSDRSGAGVAYPATFNGEQDVYYLRLFPDCNGNGASDVIDLDLAVSIDCDVDRIPDECETGVVCIVAGSVPAEAGGAEPPLIVQKIGGGQIRLTWAASCLGGDSDYAVYEGAIGDFTTHLPRTCSTSGSTVRNLVPAPGDSYYLVTPSNGIREGSYGIGDGVERPASTAACLPQAIGSCPM